MSAQYIEDKKTLVNPNRTAAENAYLGTFGEPVDHAQPLFHLDDLGGANLSNVQQVIKTIFPDGRFTPTDDLISRLKTTFTNEMLSMCDEGEKNNLTPILEKIVNRFTTFIEGDDRNLSLRRYGNIDSEFFDNEENKLKRLIMSYTKGPNIFYNYITGHNLPPINKSNPIIGTKVRISTREWHTHHEYKKKTGVIIPAPTQEYIQAEANGAEEAAELTVAEKKYKYKYTIQLDDDGTILNGSLYSSTKNPGGLFRIIEGDGPRDIWERPGPPTQCNNAFGTDKITQYDKNIFGTVTSSLSSSAPTHTTVPMRCYICFRNLHDDTAMRGDNQRMECEHIFPITESHLVWGTYLYSFRDKAIDEPNHEKHIANLKRLYAPVCNHCNISPHKSSIPVLDVSSNGRFMVNQTLITALTTPCNGANETVCMAQPGVRSNTDLHKAYLMQIFKPLVNAVNEDIKYHLGITDDNTRFDGKDEFTHPQTIRKLFLCRYLFYLDRKALSKLKILCIGGENIDNQIKKMVKAKKKWNTLWKAVRRGCKKMYNFIKKGPQQKDSTKGEPSKRNAKKYKKWLKIPEENIKVREYFEKKKKKMKEAFANFSRILFPDGDKDKIAPKIFNFFTTKRLSSSEAEDQADAAAVTATAAAVAADNGGSGGSSSSSSNSSK